RDDISAHVCFPSCALILHNLNIIQPLKIINNDVPYCAIYCTESIFSHAFVRQGALKPEGQARERLPSALLGMRKYAFALNCPTLYNLVVVNTTTVKRGYLRQHC
ncbi:MAG TPA: hypothetical protein PLX93_04950, partial [Bacilli bacterium]|nr:hypothetical protein [Bacilli bacterium]